MSNLSSGALRAQDMLGAGQGEHALQALSFGFGDAMAEAGEPVVAAALVVETEVGTVLGLFYQFLFQ